MFGQRFYEVFYCIVKLTTEIIIGLEDMRQYLLFFVMMFNPVVLIGKAIVRIDNFFDMIY